MNLDLIIEAFMYMSTHFLRLLLPVHLIFPLLFLAIMLCPTNKNKNQESAQKKIGALSKQTRKSCFPLNLAEGRTLIIKMYCPF